MSSANTTHVDGASTVSGGKNCSRCRREVECLHFINNRRVCDFCFGTWADDVERKQGEPTQRRWLVRTVHNTLLGPYSPQHLEQWLSSGALSYSVELSDSGSERWIPATQAPAFHLASEQGRVKTRSHVQNEKITKTSRSRSLWTVAAVATILFLGIATKLWWSGRSQPEQLSETSVDELTAEQRRWELSVQKLQFLKELQSRNFSEARIALTKISSHSFLSDEEEILFSSRWHRLSNTPMSESQLIVLRSLSLKQESSLGDLLKNEWGLVQWAAGNKTEALDTWAQLATSAIKPTDRLTALTNTGVAALQLSEAGRAQENFEKALTQTKDALPYWQPLYFLMNDALRQQRWEPARIYAQRALRSFPEAANFLPLLLWLNESRPTQALNSTDTHRRLLSIDPELLRWTMNPTTLISQGFTYRELVQSLQRWNGAGLTAAERQWFLDTLSLLDTSVEEKIRAQLSQFAIIFLKKSTSVGLKSFFCWGARTYNVAVDWEKDCASLEDPRIYFLRGQEALKAKDFEEVRAQAERLLTLEPGHLGGVWLKVRALMGLGRQAPATVLAEETLRVFPQYYPLYDLYLERQESPDELY